MITQADIAHWQQRVPWPTLEQIEQDLVLSRLIVEIANHPLLGNELVFRGGTCLHKLWLDRPWRYSEDLDYVRRSAGGIGNVLDAIRDIAGAAGFDQVRTDVRQHPKVRLESTFINGNRMRIKIEMNTFERSPARIQPRPNGSTLTARGLQAMPKCPPLRSKNWSLPRSALYSNARRVVTYSTSGLRWKRPVYYRGTSPPASAPTGPTAGPRTERSANLDAKLEDREFSRDLSLLLPEWPADYTVQAGAEVAKSIIQRLP